MRGFMNLQDLDNTVDVKVMVAIPSTDIWPAQFGMALASMMFYLSQTSLARGLRHWVYLINRRSSMLCQGRESLLEEAIEAGCTHILWLDSDMTFPQDTLHQLFQHNRTFVGANYVRKMIPSAPVACALDGGLCFTDEHMLHLEEVLHIGFGVALLRVTDIQDIPAPHFNMQWDEKLACYSGEDIYFCKQLREQGIPIYVDHALSQQVGHIGSFSYDHKVVGNVVDIPADEINLEKANYA